MNETNSSLKFVDYVVNNIEFKLNEHFDDQPVDLKFDIDRDVEYLEDMENTMYVNLSIKIFENAFENNYPFFMNISLTGIFELNNVEIEKREVFAEVNAVAILFPYVRSLVSSFTANANVSPLILPTINVVKLIEDKYKKGS